MATACCALGAAALPAQAPPGGYRVGVVSESGDIVSWFDVVGATLVRQRTVPVGIMPADIDGPHNIFVAPDRKSYFISIAHGTPFGSLWRLDATTDAVLGRAPLEYYPTTISATPDVEIGFVANSDFYGDRPRQNVVSVVHLPTMTKITDVPVCDMPHGVKVNRVGTKVLITCMHSDEVLEMDPATFAVTRRVQVGTGGGMAGMDHGAMAPRPSAPMPAGHQMPMAGGPMPAAPAPMPPSTGLQRECSPTFVSLSPDGGRVYVACNYGNAVLVYDAQAWSLLKEVPTGKGTYNVEPSPDGQWVIATNKKDKSVSLIDAATLSEVARIPTTKGVVHGVAFSPDSRFAFVTAESVGADPGSLDMIDLAARKVVATMSVPAQPTGVVVWRP